jgi:hypothetical protein
MSPGGTKRSPPGTAGGTINLRLPLQSVDEIDEEAVGLLRQAYEANL